MWEELHWPFLEHKCINLAFGLTTQTKILKKKLPDKFIFLFAIKCRSHIERCILKNSGQVTDLIFSVFSFVCFSRELIADANDNKLVTRLMRNNDAQKCSCSAHNYLKPKLDSIALPA